MPKRLELLSELVPQAKAIAQRVNPDNSNADRIIRDVQEAAHEGGAADYPKAGQAEIDAAFTSFVKLHAAALVVTADPFFNGRREQLVALAARYVGPAIYEYREFPAVGGLISYGPSLAGM
jgi:putative ABC transport system substrate-binding protein